MKKAGFVSTTISPELSVFNLIPSKLRDLNGLQSADRWFQNKCMAARVFGQELGVSLSDLINAMPEVDLCVSSSALIQVHYWLILCFKLLLYPAIHIILWFLYCFFPPTDESPAEKHKSDDPTVGRERGKRCPAPIADRLDDLSGSKCKGNMHQVSGCLTESLADELEPSSASCLSLHWHQLHL